MKFNLSTVTAITLMSLASVQAYDADLGVRDSDKIIVARRTFPRSSLWRRTEIGVCSRSGLCMLQTPGSTCPSEDCRVKRGQFVPEETTCCCDTAKITTPKPKKTMGKGTPGKRETDGSVKGKEKAKK
ncbi:hypothetical protein C8J56DRAFT_916070 [Mycena floridula]|nr:hypothetical protein C8J56DRAFT_916070 [Mycena floridula]